MLKRRASKRFVLAETGEPVAWDTTADNDRAQCTTPGGSSSGGGGYRRDSQVSPMSGVDVLPGPSLVFTMSTSSVASSCSSSSEGDATAATTSPDVANNANLNSAIVDGSRLAVTTLNPGGSLK